MCGLAWRCRISRSVKNACRVGASGLIAGPPDVLEALRGDRDQLSQFERGGEAQCCKRALGRCI